jgi:hypothetical protein
MANPGGMVHVWLATVPPVQRKESSDVDEATVDWIDDGDALAVQLNVVLLPLTMQLIVMLPVASTCRVVEPAVQLVTVLVPPEALTVTVWAVVAGLTAKDASAAIASKASRPKDRSRFI